MMTPLSERMVPIAGRLSRIRGAIRSLFALDGFARLALAAAAFVAVTFLLDWALHLPAGVRLVLLAGGAAFFGWILLKRLFYPLGRRISDDDLAIFVERHFPELNDRLISAIQLARDPGVVPEGSVAYNSPQLVEALVADAEQATAGLDFGRVIVGRHVGRIAAAAGVAAAVLLTGALASPALASIYFNRILGGDARWPQRTYLTVRDFDASHHRVVARGDDLTLVVEHKGIAPSKVVLEYRFLTGEKARERMSPLEGNAFQFVFTRVPGPFTFTISGGDAVTDEHTVETMNPPGIESVAVFYEYPPYLRKTNTPSDRPETSGNVVAPIGTKVRFEAMTNEDLKIAEMTLGLKGKEKTAEFKVEPDPQGRPRRFSGGFDVTDPMSEYLLKVAAENGLGNRDPIRFTIKGIEDRLPEPKVLDPLGDEYITELCERPLEIEVRDDYGVKSIQLHTRVLAQEKDKSKDWAAVEFTREQNSRDYGEPVIRSDARLDVGALGLQAGDHVEFKVRAQDYKDIGPANVKETKVYKLSIVTVGTLEKELQDAIEKIKQVLKNQKAREESAWSKSARIADKFGKIDDLSQEQQGEVRQAALEQKDITSKLETARKDIRQIMRRGVYNKIFNEAAAAKLQGAVDELGILVGEPNDATRPGSSGVAAGLLDQAARQKSGSDRTATLRDAQQLQNGVAAGIQKAIDYLEKWSSYQEVVRITRELLDVQKRAVEGMKRLGGK